jgi:acyl carrier protein
MDHLEELYEVIAPFNKHGVPLTPQIRFVDDLGLDSLSVMEVVAEIEDRFDITLPLNLLPDIHTIADLDQCIRRLRGSNDA